MKATIEYMDYTLTVDYYVEDNRLYIGDMTDEDKGDHLEFTPHDEERICQEVWDSHLNREVLAEESRGEEMFEESRGN